MFGSKSRENERLRASVDSYGTALDLHHEHRGTCEESLAPMRARRDALAARVGELEKQVTERDAENAKLAGELKAALAIIEAGQSAAKWTPGVVR